MINYNKVVKFTVATIASTLLITAIGPSLLAHADSLNSNDSIEVLENVKLETRYNPNQQFESEVIEFTNQEIFEAMEAQGVDISDYLTQQEIDSALVQDQYAGNGMFSTASTRSGLVFGGTNKIVTLSNDRFDLYINGVIATLFGGAAMGAVIKALSGIAVVKAFMASKSLSVLSLTGALSAVGSSIAGGFTKGIIVRMRLRKGTGKYAGKKYEGVNFISVRHQ